jgi:tetratricopeptide (TPR) repeat protein
VAYGARSIAIDTGGGAFTGTALTGDNARVVQLPPEVLRPPAEVQAPPGLDDLPRLPGLFVGRARELRLLDAALSGTGRVVVQAVHGLGGVGKSALAAHWAATRPHGCTPVRWITADNPDNVQQGLADLATALQPALARALPTEQLAERALQWLATHTNWLLILDNVEDPAHISALLARAGTAGRFLVTSRLATVWHHTAVVRLDILDPAESLALLTRTATVPGRDLDGAVDLCAELGHLPLAIEQAAAYLAQNVLITPRAYLSMLAAHPAAMYRTGAVGITDAERTIARIWHITLDTITAAQPTAGDLLRTLAWYAPDTIPAALAGDPTDPDTAHATGLLTAYSMITANPATATLAVHRLVQALARTPDPEDPHRTPDAIHQARDQATTHLAAALPAWDAPATWHTWRTLLPHIDALTGHAADHTDTETTATTLNLTALFLAGQGQLEHAIRLHQRALAHWVRVLGEDHPNTLTSRSNLAFSYRAAGDLGRAMALYEGTLADRTRVLGEDHPDTLNSRNNLAHAHMSAGHLDRAIALHEQSLADMVRVLGEDHPDTLKARHNLAGAYESAGDLGRAIPLYERALADRVRVLGEDHPDTLNSRSNLAYAYESAGDLGRAFPLHERALADRVRVLGEDHPDTLNSRSNLAHAYEAAGDLGRALPLLDQILADRLRVLGADHPDTLIARNNLAAAYESAGDTGRAIVLHDQTLADMVRVLGEDHPTTLISRNNLADAYRAAGHFGRAVTLHEQTLASRMRVLGDSHPDTLISSSNLAYAYRAAGDLGRAIPLYRQTYTGQVRVLGEDHPDTLATESNLAGAYRAAGDLDQAIVLFKQALANMVRVLGEDHPDTLDCGNNLISALAKRAVDGPKRC